MKDIKVYKEEFDINLEEIKNAEEIWKNEFPADFKTFLLKYNGGVPYPRYPILPSEDNSELWPIERFLSVGDIVIQKKHPMTYTLHDIDDKDFQPHNLEIDYLLVFALGERGIYFLNLDPKDYSQIYFANYSGGDGIIKVHTNSFAKFIDSLGLPEWTEEEYNPNFEFKGLYYSSYKVFQYYLYYTPNNTALGFRRFKDVFEILGDIQPTEDGYPNIPQKYVDDRQKLEFLLGKGCSTDGLLRYAKKTETIKYLIEEKGLDINKEYKGRYPLQNYLTSTYKAEIKTNYQLVNDLLEMGIDFDWSIVGTKVDGTPDLSMIEKLEKLHEEYLKYEIEDRDWWIRNGKPSGHTPFERSKLIELKICYNKR